MIVTMVKDCEWDIYNDSCSKEVTTSVIINIVIKIRVIVSIIVQIHNVINNLRKETNTFSV